MKKREYMLIINPRAGTVGADGLADYVVSRLESSERHIEVRYSEYPGHCVELAHEARRRGLYAVIAVGGDGTVNEVGRALAGSKTLMAIIPHGSGNGLARHLGIGIDVDHAIDVIDADNYLPCDYGTANGHPFFCTFGMGFDAAVSEAFSSMKRRGLTSYIRSALKEYLKYKPQEYEISTGSHRVKVKAFIIAVCNASQYGNNAYISPGASVTDGKLDITIVHYGNPLTRAFVGVDLFTGYLKRNVLIQTLQVEKARIERVPGSAHLDGDPVEMPGRIDVKCNHARLGIFYDAKKGAFHPLLTPMRSFRLDLLFRVKSMFRRLFSRRHF